MSELSDYVRQLMDKGYSEDYIRKHLQDYGYGPAEINASIKRNSGSSKVRHEHHVGGSAFAFILLIILLMGGTVYAVLQLTGMVGKEALLDVEAEPRFTEVEPGQDLGFNLRITNMGSKERFDAVLEYEVLDGDASLKSTKDTIAISTTTTRYKKISAPEEAGEYKLQATAKYDGKEASSSFTFTVSGEEEEKAPVKDNEDTSVDVSSKLEEARELAANQPSSAEETCMELEGSNRDDCLSIVVKESRRPEFCDGIHSQESRDNCYMTFIIEGQTHLCSEIELKSNQDYCNRVRDVQIMAKYYQGD